MQDITSEKVPTDYKPNVLTPQQNDYWKDYNYGQTQEALTIGNEVATPKTKSGTFDTSDTSIEKVQQDFTLSVADPD
jgi:hypothetical protein